MPMTHAELDKMSRLISGFELAVVTQETYPRPIDKDVFGHIIQRKYEARDALIKFIVEVSNK